MSLPNTISIPEAAAEVLRKLEEHSFEAYVVGGCVRDSLLGRHPKDWDICTSATPQQVLRLFRKHPVIKTGLQHGTVTVLINKRPIEVTTYRIDGKYADNRHPESVEFVRDITQDLARRDFTINAMAYHPARGLVDAFGGQQDLAAGLIRCVGEPDARFHEDGLRILRALRFAARYDFAIESETAYAIRRDRHLLTNISAERIFSELKGILCGQGALSMLLAFPEVFVTIIPELGPTIGFQQHNPYHIHDVWTHIAYAVQAAPADPILRLTMLLHDIAKPACYTMGEDGRGHFHGHAEKAAEMAHDILLRLKSDNNTLKTVVTLVRHHDHRFPTTPAGMCRLIGKLGEENVNRLIQIAQADNAAQSPLSQREAIEPLRNARLLLEEVLEQHGTFTVKDLHITGRDLIALGIPPGPAIGQILQTLLTEVQDGHVANTPATLSQRTLEIICSHTHNTTPPPPTPTHA